MTQPKDGLAGNGTKDQAEQSVANGDRSPDGSGAHGEFVEDAPPVGSNPVVVPQSFAVDKWREITRASLAIALVLLLAVVLFYAIYKGLSKITTVKEATDLLGVVLSPLVGLVGAATGFYYGSGGKKD